MFTDVNKKDRKLIFSSHCCILTGSSSTAVQKEGRTSGAEPEASTQDELPPLSLRLLPPAGLRRADHLGQKHEGERSVFCSLPWKNATQLKLDRKHAEEKEWSVLHLWWKQRQSKKQTPQLQHRAWTPLTETVLAAGYQAQGMSVLYLREFMLKTNNTDVPHFFISVNHVDWMSKACRDMYDNLKEAFLIFTVKTHLDSSRYHVGQYYAWVATVREIIAVLCQLIQLNL